MPSCSRPLLPQASRQENHLGDTRTKFPARPMHGFDEFCGQSLSQYCGRGAGGIRLSKEFLNFKTAVWATPPVNLPDWRTGKGWEPNRGYWAPIEGKRMAHPS